MKGITRYLNGKIELSQESGIQDVFQYLAKDVERTSNIVAAIAARLLSNYPSTLQFTLEYLVNLD